MATESSAIDISASDEVGQALLVYLAKRLSAPALRFAELPEQITHGWETYIYTFRLAGDGLDAPWKTPLILRVYPRADSGPQAELETSIQQFVHENGYPAPMPLAVETDVGALGHPFMVMERVAGEPMLDMIAGHPNAVIALARKMADAHVLLHRLPVDGCRLPSEGTLVERRLMNLGRAADGFGGSLPADLQKGLQWLNEHKGGVIPEEVSVCHQDFHPLNLIVDEAGALSVIDWSGAALGDRHADIASTLVLLRAPPIAPPGGWLERLMIRFGGPLLAWLYLRRYRSQLPIDSDRLRFWEVLNVFAWWSALAASEVADPAAVGLKSDMNERLRGGQLERMRDYFWRLARS